MPLRRPLIALLVVTVLAIAADSAHAAPPPASYSCTPAPNNCGGWRPANVVLRWFAPTAINTNNCPVATTIAAEGLTTWQCGVTDDNVTWVWSTATVQIDKTAPRITSVRPSRAPDSNGWYRAPVRILFGGTDAKPGIAVSGIAACAAPIYGAPDTRGTSVAGTCVDNAGNRSAAAAFPLRYDATPPDVTSGTPARTPDFHGWYNHSVNWRFTGRDGLSGLADCPAVTYSGPGGRAARVIGACRDKAGNVGARSFALRYDGSPPPAPSVQAVPRDHAVRLRIRGTGDARHIRIVRSPGRHGKRHSTIFSGGPRSFTDHRVRNGKTYRYTVIARDQANNRSRTVVIVRAGPVLVSPPDGAVLAAPPRLEWSRVRDADYFNVQLRRDGRKVLSVWPRRSKLQLRSQWRYRGQLQQLVPGRYEWDVWPGFGPRRASRYGRKIGSRTFVIAGVPPAP
jgi:hypothetical protein